MYIYTDEPVASKWHCSCNLPWLKCPTHFPIVSNWSCKHKGIIPKSNTRAVSLQRRSPPTGKLGDPFVKRALQKMSTKKFGIGMFTDSFLRERVTSSRKPSSARHKPLIKRQSVPSIPPVIKREYASNKSIFEGSKVLKALMHRGVVQKEQIESRMKVLKSAEHGCNLRGPPPQVCRPVTSRPSNPDSSSRNRDSVSALVVGEPTVAKPQKRKASPEWPALALEKHARIASKK